MKIRFISSSLLAVVFLASQAAADTITLKDGKVLEGKILNDKGDSYEIEYNVNKSGSIKDKKRVLKTDVANVSRVRPEDKDFEAIAKLVPTPDLLTVADYQQRIQAVNGFLAKYPKVSKAKEADAILKTLTKEMAEVEAGGRKLNNLMVPAAQYRADAYDMDAKVLEAKILTAVKDGKQLAALRAFAELDRDFQGSASYRAVVPAVLKTLQAFRTQVNASLASYDSRMEKREADLAAMGAEDRANTTRALSEEATQLEARYQAEKAAQQAWVTPHRDHKQSLEDCASLAESEIQRLVAPAESSTTGDPGKAYRTAWKIFQGEADAEAAEKALADAEATGLPEKYMRMLEDAAKASGAIKPDAP
jgi:hypothetical protein